jgi:undecaprenyl-diphosphatase
MHHLLEVVQRLDLGIYDFFNRLAGNWIFDRVVLVVESNCFLKSGFFATMYWYFWFHRGPDQDRRRRMIIGIMIGILLALVVTRSIAIIAPQRVRPIYDQSLEHRLSTMTSDAYEDWNSFPSDTATLACALTFGLIYLKRRTMTPVLLYTALWICVPRIYLGLHYASDILAGAGIAFAAVWVSLRSEWLRTRFASAALAWIDARPGAGYAIAFLVSFEAATMFWDVRGPAHSLMHAARIGPYHKEIMRFAITVGVLGFVVVAACIAFWYCKGRRQDPWFDTVSIPLLRALSRSPAAPKKRSH